MSHRTILAAVVALIGFAWGTSSAHAGTLAVSVSGSTLDIQGDVTNNS